MAFQIPQEYSEKFQEFFDSFDRDLEKLGIKSYGISVPTLEDVFLKVTNEKIAETGEKKNSEDSEEAKLSNKQ